MNVLASLASGTAPSRLALFSPNYMGECSATAGLGSPCPLEQWFDPQSLSLVESVALAPR